jgi:hypothetical protein
VRNGEANRLHKDNTSAVILSKTGTFASPYAYWDRLQEQHPVNPIYQPKLAVHSFQGAAATVFQQIAAASPNASAQTFWDLMLGIVCTAQHKFRATVHDNGK